jgi:hypothetical protein
MIIGFPFQDRSLVLEDFRKLTELGPALWQVLIYFAFPGTPLHRQVLAEGRYLPAYQEKPDYRTFDGFSMHFKHPHFTPAELENLQRELYRKAFALLGPSLIRVVRTWFEGYRNLKHSSNPLLRGRAERMKGYVRSAIPGLYPAIFFGPNGDRKNEARELLKGIKKELGPVSPKERLFGWATIPLSAWTWLAAQLNLFQQPRLLRIEHRMNGQP